MKACVIAAPMTGSGKTTVTIGLLSALAARGLSVQPFKVGPDFIDAGLHELAGGVPSHNLDGWMLSREANTELFVRSARDKDFALVEGVMGLFDGFDGKSDAGSTAEIARWLDLPIILVIDAYPLARSAAAIVHGFRTFDPRLKFAGIIFNRVAGEGHFRILSDAVSELPILGWLPPNADIEIRERHLGLMTGQELEAKIRIQNIAEFFVRHIPVDRLLEILPETKIESLPEVQRRHIQRRVRVALARDPAFSFYYHANRMALESAGAEIVEFSLIQDSKLPDAEFLYIGGGYPELYREELEANLSMRQSVRKYIESGRRFYAECGGLMYLSRTIESSEMAGVLPTDIRLTDRPVDFGYCEVTTTRASILGPAGTRIRGHQFHYSKCLPPASDPVYAVRQGAREYGEGWALPNGVASYIHLHFLSNPEVVRTVLQS